MSQQVGQQACRRGRSAQRGRAKSDSPQGEAGPVSGRVAGGQARSRRAARPALPSCQLGLRLASRAPGSGRRSSIGSSRPAASGKQGPAARQRSRESARRQPDGDPLGFVRPTDGPGESSQRLAASRHRRCGNESVGRRVATRRRPVQKRASASLSRPRAHKPADVVRSLPRHRAPLNARKSHQKDAPVTLGLDSRITQGQPELTPPTRPMAGWGGQVPKGVKRSMDGFPQ